jgi:hypothetical protein
MKTYWVVDVQFHELLTFELDGDKSSVSRPGRFNTWETAPGTRWIGDYVGREASLDAVGKKKSLPLL